MGQEPRGAIITGGGTGVGRETALLLAERGYHVAINYSRSKEEAEATAGDIEAKGVKAHVQQANVSDDAACRAFVKAAADAFGRLDVLVNNAGTTSFIPHDNLEAVKTEDWERIYAVNVIGAFQCARAAKDELAKTHGHVVNVSSTAGIMAMGSSIPYCASKAAMLNMTIALARVFAPEVQVNAVAPGFITGRWLENGLGDSYEPFKNAVEARLPLERVCDPIDVARAIVSLVEGSPLVTGQTVVCDSGMTIGKAPI